MPNNTNNLDKRVGILRKGRNVLIERPKAEIVPKKRVIRSERDYIKDIHFACPRCDRMFKSYFSSRQHIVRYHCVNENDEPVSENSPDIIKPIQRERCLKCQTNIDSDNLHLCPEDTPDLSNTKIFVCLGCNQQFADIKLFDIHVPRLHNQGVQSMFFQKQDDIIDWIAQIEDSTDSNYKLKSYNNSRQIYRCTHSPKDGNIMLLCPSSLHIHEYYKKYQVNFYTQHHGHNCKVYQITKRDRKNLITSLLEQADNYHDITNSLSDPKDLYVQFKNVMEKIILEAAKLDQTRLKELMGKALELSEVLNEQDIDDENATNAKPNKAVVNLNDKQITDALQDTGMSKKNKRKSSITLIPNSSMEEIEEPLEKSKKSAQNKKLPLIVNSYSLSDVVEKEIKKKEKSIITPKPRFLDSLSETPSFNDTYKNFIGKSYVDTRLPATRKNVKKNIVKTKMGQFKPNFVKRRSTSDAKPESPPPPLTPVKIEPLPKDISYEIKEQENDYNILILKF